MGVDLKQDLSKGKISFENPFVSKDMRRMRLKLTLLMRIKQGRIYSYALMKELSHSKHFLLFRHLGLSFKNDIYNTVKSLEKSGYIKVNAIIEDNRMKKYYTITNKGKKALAESKKLFLHSMKELMKLLK